MSSPKKRFRFVCGRCGHLSTQHNGNGTCAWCKPGVCDRLVLIFTPRELEVLKLLAAGEGTKGAAQKLNLSSKTIEAHLYNMLSKTRLTSRLHLILAGLRSGVLELKDLPATEVLMCSDAGPAVATERVDESSRGNQ